MKLPHPYRAFVSTRGEYYVYRYGEDYRYPNPRNRAFTRRGAKFRAKRLNKRDGLDGRLDSWHIGYYETPIPSSPSRT